MARRKSRPKPDRRAEPKPAMVVRPGDVVLYRDGAMLEPQVGTVFGTPTPRALELYCGTWIPRDSVVRVIRHVDDMPTPSSIATAMMRGEVQGPQRQTVPRETDREARSFDQACPCQRIRARESARQARG